MSDLWSSHGFGTRAIHAGQAPDPTTGALMPPIYQNSTYAQPAPAEPIDGFDYSRTKNPTRLALEQNVASLEGADYGLAFSSGMAAINTVLNLLSQGDHVIAGNDLYGGTYRLFETLYRKFGVDFTYVDMTDLDQVKAAVRAGTTKMVYLETPTNPLLRIADLAALAEMAHDAGALAICDNTFATPYLQQPLNLGCDVVLHSTTKYMGGHSDVVGGAIATPNAELHDQLAFFQNTVGGVPGPQDCFLVMRGLKTLHVRMERHCSNAAKVAEYLVGHAAVDKVIYPGLESHPGHEIAARQMNGFGGMISFVARGSLEQGKRVVSSTKIFALAESLGGVESLIEHPPSMTHASIPTDVRHAAGLEDGLMRVSVGIEDVDDLIADLDQALAHAG